MVNQQVFSRTLRPERHERLFREIDLCSVHIGIEFNDVGYDVFDDLVGYIDDDWGIMLAHL